MAESSRFLKWKQEDAHILKFLQLVSIMQHHFSAQWLAIVNYKHKHSRCRYPFPFTRLASVIHVCMHTQTWHTLPQCRTRAQRNALDIPDSKLLYETLQSRSTCTIMRSHAVRSRISVWVPLYRLEPSGWLLPWWTVSEKIGQTFTILPRREICRAKQWRQWQQLFGRWPAFGCGILWFENDSPIGC